MRRDVIFIFSLTRRIEGKGRGLYGRKIRDYPPTLFLEFFPTFLRILSHLFRTNINNKANYRITNKSLLEQVKLVNLNKSKAEILFNLRLTVSALQTE